MKKPKQFLLLLNMPKNILKAFFVLLLFLKSNFAFSQWQLTNSGTTNNIVDICFPTDSIGYAVTDNGEVLKTIDEGNNWNVLTTLTGNFTSICALGVDTIFVGGNNIYRSDDGGNSWSNIITLGYTITDLLFFNSQKGIFIKPGSYTCTSSQGQVTITSYEALSTIDSGNTWLLTFSELQSYSRFQLIDDTTAYVTGGSYNIFDHCNGAYFNFGVKTTDGGSTWSTSNIPGWWYSAFYFVNDTLEYLLGGTTLYRITSSSTQVRQMTYGVNQLVFINEIDGYLLSGNDIYKTNSEGFVWYFDTVPTTTALNMLCNDYNKAMFAVGANGTILKKIIIESLYPDSIYSMTANQTQLQFDTTVVGGTKTKSIIIHNDGSVPLNINVAASDTFQVSTSNNMFSSNINFTLAAQRDSVVNVRFSPTDTLFYQDTLVISTDSVNSIYIALSGFGTNNLIGHLSDSMVICKDTINVVGDFTIDNGGKLVICPGTVVYFKGNYYFNISGTLIAEGLPNDSIIFIPENNIAGWQGISFNSTTNPDTSVLRYCSLSYVNQNYSYTVESSYRTKLLVDHCSIHNSKGGIYSRYGTITISNNKIFDNNIGNYPGCGVKLFYDSSLVINNEIFNNTAGEGAGIWMLNHAPGSPKIIQNLIFNNTGTNASLYLEYGNPSLINNTICNNKATSPANVGGVYHWAVDSNTLVLNNIIYNNSGTQLYAYWSDSLTVEYCDIQGGYSSGVGNINQNPQFVNPTDSIGVMNQIGIYNWSLTQNSPCINAGDTVFNTLIPSLDFAGNPRIYQSRIDIGAYEHQQLISVNEIESNNSISLFPNPFTVSLNIFVLNNQQQLEFVLYDLLSRKLLQQKFTDSFSLNTEQLAKGVYIYEVRNVNGLCKKGKVVKD